MFVVERRIANTLIQLYKANVMPETERTSDEWRAYNNLNCHKYKHYTVNEVSTDFNYRIKRII